MNANTDLLQRIDGWKAEGLITSQQAAALRARVSEEEERTVTQQVMATEILVYLGSLIVFLALAFLAILNWEEFGSTGRVLLLLAPALALFALGWPLRAADDARRRRGAQALWLGASLIAGVFFLVFFTELGLVDWRNLGPADFHFLLSCLLAGGVSGLAYALLPTVAQSIPFHFWLTIAFLSFMGWLEMEFPSFNPWINLALGLLMGVIWLAFAAWLNRQGRGRLAAVSLLVGAVTALATPYFLSQLELAEFNGAWERTAMEVISLVTSLLFIAASVRFQSRILLYSGATFLLLLITYVNFAHFADQVGMPIALFLTGVALIGLGLGTGWLNRLMGKQVPAG